MIDRFSNTDMSLFLGFPSSLMLRDNVEVTCHLRFLTGRKGSHTKVDVAATTILQGKGKVFAILALHSSDRRVA
jgi:hypothetical protein